MKTSEAPGRHLTPDEIVDRVFPADEQPAPVPLHLAACPGCQEKVSNLREASLPGAFWNAQAASILAAATDPAPAEPARTMIPFSSFHRSFLRRPALAFGSLAAALALVAGITYTRLRTPPATEVAQNVRPPAATPAAASSDETDKKDDELLRSIDEILADDGPVSPLVPQGVS